MRLDPCPFVIIQPGTTQTPVIELEPEWFYEMQLRTGIGAQAYDVARIGRYFRLVEDDVEHVTMSILAGEVRP